MNYRLELGAWNSVFAVPSVIVDKHIKLAGAAQLKVILWILRHAGESFTVEDIGKALSMHEADVRDSMQYWIQTGIIAEEKELLTPAPAENIVQHTTQREDIEDKSVDTEKEAALPLPIVVPAQTNKKRALSRPEKPDFKYLSERMKNDADIAFLMQSADEIFGRMTSNNDKATLLMIHEYDGLPVEVLIMLLQYAFSAGKGNMRYIEKMAISWSDEEINTLERAESKIRQLTSGREAARRVQRIFGLDEHSPTEKESEAADLWINRWKLSDEMLRAAYETCIDTKGKYILRYISSILDNWYHSGIKDVAQLKKNHTVRKSQKGKQGSGYQPTYNINEYESTSVLDEEWDE